MRYTRSVSGGTLTDPDGVGDWDRRRVARTGTARVVTGTASVVTGTSSSLPERAGRDASGRRRGRIVLLGQVKVEGPMPRVAPEASEVGVAAVADRDFRQQRVQGGIDEGSSHEARVIRREGREGRAHHHHGQTDLLVEVPLDVEL